jgi:predicted phosphohydrolase
VRATWLTDVHLNFLRPLALRAFFDRIKAEHPDVVLITGDIAEAHSVEHFLDQLAAHVGTPIYFVLGNHDFYRSSIHQVRSALARRRGPARWLPVSEPVRLTDRMAMIGVDGWGDARCGDLTSKVQLSDWQLIEEFAATRYDRPARIRLLQEFGATEAAALRAALARTPASEELLVLTHVPPFPEACIYNGVPSEPAWLPWFTCVSTGEVLLEHAERHPETSITVLCGHSHGAGVYAPRPNLEVRTGGWPPDVEGYGNPIVQATLEL